MTTKLAKFVLIALVCVLSAAKSSAETKPLCFTALDNNATIRLDKKFLNRFSAFLQTISLCYSTDGETWKTFKINTPYNVSKGDTLYIRANKNNCLFSNPIFYYNFNIQGSDVAACGDVTTLLNANGTDRVPAHAFYGLFANCKNLTKAPELSATNVGKLAYAFMFNGCSNLAELTITSDALNSSATFKWMDGVPAGCTVTCPLDVDAASLKGTILPSDCAINYTVDGSYNEDDGVCVAADAEVPSYTRKMSYRWNTVVLPFSIEYKQDNGNYKLYYLSGMNNNNPSFTQYEDGETIAAGTPMILKAVGALVDSAYTVKITSNNFEISTNITPQTTSINTNMVEGWTVNGTYSDIYNQTDVYYIAKNKYLYAKLPVQLCAYRAWFDKNDTSSDAKKILFSLNDITTNIDELCTNDAASLKVYNIAGQKITNSEKGQINIINGKKFLNK